MIMHVSPSASSAAETLRTLRFGERCQLVTLGSVRRVARKADRSAELDEKVKALQARLLLLCSWLLLCSRELDEKVKALQARLLLLCSWLLLCSRELDEKVKALQARVHR